MSSAIEIGTCDMCGERDVPVSRTYYHYRLYCTCCNGNYHFEIVCTCKNCKPEAPLDFYYHNMGWIHHAVDCHPIEEECNYA